MEANPIAYNAGNGAHYAADAGVPREIVANIKRMVQAEIADSSSGTEAPRTPEQRSEAIKQAVYECAQTVSGLSPAQVQALSNELVADFLGYGPLEPLLDDESITEIMVNSSDGVFVEQNGLIHAVPRKLFDTEDDIVRIIDRIASETGRHCDANSPLLDARLRDGSRVNAVLQPVSTKGTSLTIRKFPKHRFDGQDLIDIGTASYDIMNFLVAAVQARCNILVSGGTGTGKTTMLNILSNFIPDEERVVTVEDTRELQLHHRDWVALEARQANSEGKGGVSVRDLVINTLRMRPDRIIVGECRAGETIDMLQAMNTGHDGSLTTVHANDPKGAFTRIRTMIATSSEREIPQAAVDMQIASGIQIVVQLKRCVGGARKVSKIVALTGSMESGVIVTQDLFEYVQLGIDRKGKAYGYFRGCGNQPPKQVLERMAAEGCEIDDNWFFEREGAREAAIAAADL